MDSVEVEVILGRQLNDTEKRYAPSQLYIQGSMDLPITAPKVSVVGTRRPTKEGIAEAQIVSKMLVENGVAVVSGLAMGIDTVAHRTAIDQGGKTVAVLGTPLDKVYPTSNYGLQKEIAKNHLVVSQFPIGYPITKGNFVRRNRTMALMSNATVIVEAGDGSGTLHQGWEALRLKRPLFVCSPTVKASPTWLVQMEQYGAILLEDRYDILNEIPEEDGRLIDIFV